MASDDTELLDLARDLHDRGRIPDALYRVWAMHRYGYTFGEIRAMLLLEQIALLKQRIQLDPREADKTFDEEAQRGLAESTVRGWYHRAQSIVEKEEDRRKEGLPRLGVTGERSSDPYWYQDTVVTKVLKKTG